MEYNQIFLMFKDIAGLPMAIIMSLAFLSLVIFLSVKLPGVLSAQNTLISNNTDATQAMSKSVDMLGGVLKEITTEFAVHDQRTKNLQSDLHDLQDDVSDIKQNGATKNELIAIHGRLDTVVNSVGIIQGKVE